ncbi:energy transducer TonB [Qipengyuania flava]|uniref:energy transducer TonB n=1 Tax=Qipengyuania flava TaxID=192812 RepID=UPI001C62EC05|nr:energy transducer TonB [Qipengyuania flava]QYJ07242.1 energy transducer TonB [Qipengyuania flava]
MGRTIYFLAAGSLLVAAPAYAQDEPPVVVAPSAPWEVDFAANRCRAARTFGTGEERTLLLLEQITPSRSPRWVMAGAVAEDMKSGGPVSVQFGPGLDAWEMEGKKRTTLGSFGAAYRSASMRKPDLDWRRLSKKAREHTPEESEELEEPVGLGLLDVEEGRSIDWVSFQRGKRPAQRLDTGNLGQLFELLNTCMSDLVRTWGVDVEAHARRAKAPEPLNIEEIARRIQQYYPGRAERWGRQADLSLRVLIDEEGAPTKCQIVNVSVAENFDDRACEEFMKVGKFKPALDIDGAPMASFYATTIAYRLR